MKQTFLIVIAIFTFTMATSQTKSYGQGVLLFIIYNLESQQEISEEKYADILKLVKNEDSYELYFSNLKGDFKITFSKLKGLKDEEIEGQYVDNNGDVYLIKDLLDTSVKALDALNTRELPNISNRYRVMLRILIK